MTDRPYLLAIEELKLCHAALGRQLPPEERRIVLAMHRRSVLLLDQLARSDDARVARINRINEEKQLTVEQAASEKAQVHALCERYRRNLKGRFSRAGAVQWICATSVVPKKRVTRYLKELPLDRGEALSPEPPTETA